jgi:tRNA modification GTPase
MERETRAEREGQRAEAACRAALLTPPGAAAIAVVRLVGPAVQTFLDAHFSAKPRIDHCVHGNLIDGQQIIDDPVVVLSGDGRCADINLHGGSFVIRQFLELARQAGFDVAANAEDLLDADDAIEREIIAAILLARTQRGLRMLLAQPQLWRKFDPAAASKQQVEQILADRSLWWMLHPPRVAIVGIPNAGKSTLANALFGQQRSITADLPGTTRDWVGDWANIDGLPVLLLDTPGQREALADPIERAAIAASRVEIDRADLVIVVLDPTQEYRPQDELMRRHPQAIVAVNKSDLPACWNTNLAGAIQTVATTGSGLDELTNRICGIFGCPVSAPIEQLRFWTARQKAELEAAASRH